MNKIMSASQALASVKSGTSIMIGGFFFSGCPFSLIRELMSKAGELSGLTLISNDACSQFQRPEAIGNELFQTGMISRVICSFLGHNDAAMKLAAEGKLEVDMMPMGTFAERIRAGGAGLGGVLTPTGVGTPIAEGKRTIELDGKTYLLETPLRADLALVYGTVVDEYGNAYLRGNSRNFNTVMATAADYVVIEAKSIVKGGDIDPDMVMIPAPYVDAIVKAGES